MRDTPEDADGPPAIAGSSGNSGEGARRPPAEPWLQLACFVGLATAVAWPGLAVPYCLDDWAPLNGVAALRLGALSPLAYLFMPHNEHTVLLLRMAIWASTGIAGLDAVPMHVLFLVVHAVTAWAAGDIAARLGGGRRASWIAGCVFATAGGVASTTLWNVTVGVFVLGCCGLALATRELLVEPAPRVGRALGWIALGAGGLNGVAVAAVALAPLLWIRAPRQASGARSRWGGTFALLALAAALVAGTAWNYARISPHGAPHPSWAGVLRGLWLVALVPARTFLGWLPVHSATALVIGVVGVGGGLALGITWLRLERPRRWILLLLWSAPALLALVIGLARAGDPLNGFFANDRYFYPFLLPFAVHLALAAEPFARLPRASRARRLGFVAAGVLAVAALVFAGRRFRDGLFPGPIAAARSSWQELDRLAETLCGHARAPSARVTLPPGRFTFAGGGTLDLATLALDTCPTASARFAVEPLRDAASEQELNRALDDWAMTLPGGASPWCVRGGILVERPATDRTSCLRFGTAAAPLAERRVDGGAGAP